MLRFCSVFLAVAVGCGRSRASQFVSAVLLLAKENRRNGGAGFQDA